MQSIPSALQTQFVAFLNQNAVPNDAHASCLKWLRYYFDFCEKYGFPHAQTGSLAHFLHKLEEKKQTHAQ